MEGKPSSEDQYKGTKPLVGLENASSIQENIPLIPTSQSNVVSNSGSKECRDTDTGHHVNVVKAVIGMNAHQELMPNLKVNNDRDPTATSECISTSCSPLPNSSVELSLNNDKEKELNDGCVSQKEVGDSKQNVSASIISSDGDNPLNVVDIVPVTSVKNSIDTSSSDNNVRVNAMVDIKEKIVSCSVDSCNEDNKVTKTSDNVLEKRHEDCRKMSENEQYLIQDIGDSTKNLNNVSHMNESGNELSEKDIPNDITFPVVAKSTVKKERTQPRKDECVLLSPYPPQYVHTKAPRKRRGKKKETDEDRTCSGCGKMFESQAVVEQHEPECPFMESDLMFSCPLCQVTFTRKHGLKKHMQRKHPKIDTFPCKICDTKISPVHDFLQHLHAHLKSIKKKKKRAKKLSRQSKDKSESVAQLPVSEFICIECNMNVKNDHSLVLHMLAHKINETLKIIYSNDSKKDETENECPAQTSSTLDMNLLSTDDGLSALGNYSSQSDVSFVPSSLLRDSFESVSPELISTINRSLYVMTFLLQRLHAELKWTDRTGPKSTEDLIKKFKALSRMSSGITEVSNCLEQLLAERDQTGVNNVQSQITKESKIEDNQFKVDDNNDNNDNDDKDSDENDDDVAEDDADDPKVEIDNDNDEMENLNDTDDKDNAEDYIPDEKKTRMVQTSSNVGKRMSEKNKDNYDTPRQRYVCGKISTHVTTFNRHKLIHDGVKPFVCEICFKEFRQKHQKNRHYQVHTMGGKFICNLCDYRVKTRSTFLKHLAEKHNHHSKVNEADKVDDNEELTVTDDNDGSDDGERDNGEMADNNDGSDDGERDNVEMADNNDGSDDGEREGNSLPSSKRNLLEKNNFVCSECGMVLSHYSSYMRHKMIHENRKPHHCTVCSKGFRRKHQLQRHAIMHNRKDNKYRCDDCNFCTNVRAVIEKHLLEHDSQRLYDCDTCGHKSKTTYEQTQHKKTHKPRDCKYCSYHAANLSDLKIHERKTHLSLSCPQCTYACFSQWQLRRHMETHNKDTTEYFFCELCGFSCSTKRQFSYHMIRHTNSKPFTCPECDYRCSSRASLASHKLMHAGLRPFLCSICGVSFRRTSHLNNHLLIHKDAKDFVCRTCGHPFRTRHNLKIHEMIHTGEKHHKCHLCPFASRRNKELRLHLEKHVTSSMEMEVSDQTVIGIIPKEEVIEDLEG